jgi:tRNA threonylcarbamoyladenosine biosynthesis protein TsaB
LLTLALDTTTRAGSVAVVREDRVLALLDGDPSRTHGERLPGEIDEAMRRAGVAAAALELLVVATGPGAFTGLRIGLATIQGIAMVTGLPVVGVSALDALAHSVRGELAIVTWMDAARGEVFSALYDPPFDDPRPRGDASVGDPAAALAALPRVPAVFVGDGAAHYRSLIEQARPDAVVFDRTVALAPSLAAIGQRRAAAGAAGPPHALQPLYVRRSDAELERSRQSRT